MFANFPRLSRDLIRGSVATTIPANLRYCTVPFIAHENIFVGAAVTVDEATSTPNRPRLKMYRGSINAPEKIAGISVFNPQRYYEIDEYGNKIYPVGSKVSVLEQGDIVMYCETPVNFNGDVITRVRVEEGSELRNEFIGNLSSTLEVPNGATMPYCRFVEMTTKPGLVIMNITMVGT